MPADSKLELVVTVDADKANASIKTVNAGLSSLESTAVSAARGASRGIDGMTTAMVKGATAGNLFADAIKAALSWAKAWTIDAAKLAAHEARLVASTLALARAHGVNASAALKAVEAVRKIGYHGEEAQHAISRLTVADMDLAKAEGLAKKIAELAGALSSLSLASAGLKAGLIGGGIAALGFVFYEEKRKWDERTAQLDEDMKRTRIQQMVREVRSLRELEQAGLAREEIIAGIRGPSVAIESPRREVVQTGPTEEDLKLQAEIRKRQAEAARTTLESALAAEAEGVKGPAKALLEIQREARRLTTFVDERGVIHRYTLLAQTRHNLERELQAKLRHLARGSPALRQPWLRPDWLADQSQGGPRAPAGASSWASAAPSSLRRASPPPGRRPRSRRSFRPLATRPRRP